MINIKKVDEDKQIVFAEVYAPALLPDSDGDIMSSEEIELMAHNFMKSYSQGSIDVGHDNNIVAATVIESFIARKEDPIFIEGSWVVGIHIEDTEIWKSVKDGDLNGLSMEGIGKGTEREIEIEIPAQVAGKTVKEEGHAHKFIVKFDDDGKFLGGSTDEVDGHSHAITSGTVTEENDGHKHKFSYVEVVVDG